MRCFALLSMTCNSLAKFQPKSVHYLMGTVVGAVIMAVLYTGLVMLNVPPFWQFGAVGVIIIMAVLVDQAQAGIARR